MIFRFTETDIKAHPFILNRKAAFYKFLFEKLTGKNYDTDCGPLNCTRINVARNIQQIWEESAQKQGISTADFNMQLLLCGPKAIETLSDFEVEVLDKAICFQDGSYFNTAYLLEHKLPSGVAIHATEEERTMFPSKDWYLIAKTATEKPASTTKPAITEEHAIELLNSLVEHMFCTGTYSEIIDELINKGFTKNDLRLLNFDENNIEEAFTKTSNSDDD